ncbi:MAG TPA: alpha-amylase [Spirochaetia bacterium]|nr:alpha-amylase [Spirochaetia bacterium]
MITLFSISVLFGSFASKKTPPPKDPNDITIPVEDNKFVVYQMMTRLFGNKVTTNKYYGTIEENGVGKFNDINTIALQSLKDFGVTHIWYTGVIEHGVLTDYSKFGIKNDDADVIKGRAGSPYAIKDYYDVNPDLAVDVKNRMKEFEDLIQRTHDTQLKVIIDFVPNHVARDYNSDAKPKGVDDFGVKDNKTVSFDKNNNYYYIPGENFIVPQGYESLGKENTYSTKDRTFTEFPAKVTGNDVFKAQPSINDWFETVKLNYGVDIQNKKAKHFDPIPDTWFKMRDILTYWAGKKVDGFRCDMAEMVPVEFWAWVIPEIKKVNPEIIFIAEIYNKGAYRDYVEIGKFDFLYDKSGLYDAVRALMSKNDAQMDMVNYTWLALKNLNSKMLRFLENHDEQRIAYFGGGNVWKGITGMTLSATLGSGPVMMYSGQEVGEAGAGVSGFSKEDGRTTIFDYWGVPEHQKWMNDGAFDGGKLSADQKKLREAYSKLLHLVQSNNALRKGNFYELHFANKKNQSNGYDDTKLYSYVRFDGDERIVVIVNFDSVTAKKFKLKITDECFSAMGLDPNGKYILKDLFMTENQYKFDGKKVRNRGSKTAGVDISIDPLGAYILRIEKQ